MSERVTGMRERGVKGRPEGSGTPKKYEYSEANETTSTADLQMAAAMDGGPVVDQDTLKQLLGPESGIGFVAESPEDTIPEELGEFLAANDFATRSFSVILKQSSEGEEGTGGSMEFVRSWHRKIPSMQYIVRHYGPGSYMFVVIWKTRKDDDGGVKNRSDKIPFEISTKCQAEYEEYQLQRRIENRKRQQGEVAKIRMTKQIDDSLDGDLGTVKPAPSAAQSAKEYIAEVVSVARDLGLSKADAAPATSMTDTLIKLAPLIGMAGEMLKAFMPKQDGGNMVNSLMTMILAQSEKHNQQLLEVVRSSTGAGAGNNAITEFKNMVMGAIDLKEAINGTKTTAGDRVFGLIEGILPQFMSIMALNKAAQASDPRVNLARAFVQTNPDFQQVLSDPAQTVDMINRMDDHYGWRQTDNILAVMKIERPATCPRDPGKEKPVDERDQVQEQPQAGPVFMQQDNVEDGQMTPG